MANKHRGEIELEANGKTYVAVLDLNVMAELEEHYDMSMERLFARLSNDARIRDMRTVMRFALKAKHPDEFATADADKLVGDIITEVGLVRFQELVQSAVKAAFPDRKEGSEAGAGIADPSSATTGAANGTGRDLSSGR